MWQISKRSKTLQSFDKKKVYHSIIRAQDNINTIDEKIAKKIADLVFKDLKTKFSQEAVIGTDDVGDSVERILLEENLFDIAKAYIIARERQRQEARAGRGLGVKNDLGLSYNQLIVISNKYLQKNETGLIIETPKQMFERVAKAVALAEKKSTKKWQKEFFDLMSSFRFLPGGRTLANAGTVNNQLANCFVLPMPDSVDGVFEVVKESSILKKNGGGVGFSLGKIRPKGDLVSTTTGRACGPVAIMHILNNASDMLLQAGGRRSGNMIVMPVTHPDIFEFLTSKEEETSLNNINFSLGATSKFMKAVEKDQIWPLINPRNGEVVNKVEARSIFDLATTMAWKNGDPGIIFLDKINKHNPTAHVGVIEAVNLCGEQPLLPYEACNLGSINLAKHIARIKNQESRIKGGKNSENYEVDWEKLKETVYLAVRFLDNVVSICKYPLEKVDKQVKQNRKIGLGIMGWADMLVRLGIAYNSPQALKLAEKLAEFIQTEGVKQSQKLAEEKGHFPSWKGSSWQKKNAKPMRNATITTIAPTGSIAMAAGCSYGIEPHFALAFYKQVMGGYKLPEMNQDLLKCLQKEGIADNGEIQSIMDAGSIQHLKNVPEKVRKVFVTAHDLSIDDHIKMQASWQKHTDNAVSKTVNMRHDATVADVAKAFLKAWKLGCKGLTVYRDTSRTTQVLHIGQDKKSDSNYFVENSSNIKKAIKKVARKPKSESCPQCGGSLQIHEGCKSCPSCGFSACSI
jgi:ribonucleoside-diphosphate reductase alpha chain